MRKIGIGLIIASFVMWLPTLAVPLLAVSIGQKAAIASILFIIGETMFWLGVLIVGKEVADRYRQWFNPRYVWRRIRRSKRR